MLIIPYTDCSDILSQNGFSENKRNAEMIKNENGYPVSARCPICPNGMTQSVSNTPRGVAGDRNAISGERQREGCSNGMNGGCGGRGDCLDGELLAYVYAPDQRFRLLYSAMDALKHGTLFEELYKPMEVYGNE